MNDITTELSLLHTLSGIQFVKQLELITQYAGFTLVKGETDIFSVGGESEEDYNYLLEAAHKAVEHGNKVYILPNPRSIRTADNKKATRGQLFINGVVSVKPCSPHSAALS